MLSNIVYKIPCKGCNSCYVGQIRQYLKTRCSQHKQDCNYENRDNPKTGLAKHHFQEGHIFDFEAVSVINHKLIYQKRLFLEMSHIQRTTRDVQDLNIIPISPSNYKF